MCHIYRGSPVVSMANVSGMNVGLCFKNEAGTWFALCSTLFPTITWYQDGHHFQVMNKDDSSGYNVVILPQRAYGDTEAGPWWAAAFCLGVGPTFAFPRWTSFGQYIIRTGQELKLPWQWFGTKTGKPFFPLPEINSSRVLVAELTFPTFSVSVKKNDLEYACLKANSERENHFFVKAENLLASFTKIGRFSMHLSVVLS